MIGLALIIGFLEYSAALFGIFIMINKYSSRYDFTYPVQLSGFIFIALNKECINSTSVKTFINKFNKKEAG